MAERCRGGGSPLLHLSFGVLGWEQGGLFYGGGVGSVYAPAVEHCFHVVGYGTFEVQVLLGGGVVEPENEGVESLARKQSEVVLNKLLVAREGGAFEYSVASVGCIVEEGMAYVSHVGSDLVGAAGFEYAFHQCDVAETFYYPPVCYGMFATFGVVGDVHDAAVLG